jgi:uncharacterized protein YhfF
VTAGALAYHAMVTHSSVPLPAEYADLPIEEFAFPGPLRELLVAAILDGSKTSTTFLHMELEIDGEELPVAGLRSVVIDSAEHPVAVIELTEVRVLPLAEVDRQHAIDEGEGFEDVASWRRGHEEFWHSEEYREAVGDPGFTVDDSMLAVALRFRRVADLRRG